MLKVKLSGVPPFNSGISSLILTQLSMHHSMSPLIPLFHTAFSTCLLISLISLLSHSNHPLAQHFFKDEAFYLLGSFSLDPIKGSGIAQ